MPSEAEEEQAIRAILGPDVSEEDFETLRKLHGLFHHVTGNQRVEGILDAVFNTSLAKSGGELVYAHLRQIDHLYRDSEPSTARPRFPGEGMGLHNYISKK